MQSKIAVEIPDKKQMRRHILDLSWPCAVELMLASLLGMVTMAMVSTLGKETVSAVGITNQPILIPNVILQAFAVGGTALVARFLGEGDIANSRRACEQTMFLSIIFSVIAGVLLYVFGDAIMLWMGATEDYFLLAQMYMRYCAVGVIFQSVSAAISALLRGAGKTRLSMQFNVATNVANVVIGYVLIHGFGPIPALGLLGAAIAQLAAKLIGCLYALAILFYSKNLSIKPRVRNMFIPDRDIISRIFRVGVSSALEQLAMRVGMMLFTIYIVRLGTAEYAAHNIAGTVHNYVVNFGQAVSVALVSLVGQNLGANRPDVAEKYFSESFKICFIGSVILMIPLLTFPHLIARLFTDEMDVIANFVTALRILAFFVFGQVMQINICGGLRGGGDTKWPLISTMSGVLGMRMVIGYLFIVRFGWGLAGAWWCWLLDQNLRAVIIYFRFRGRKWKTIKV